MPLFSINKTNTINNTSKEQKCLKTPINEAINDNIAYCFANINKSMYIVNINGMKVLDNIYTTKSDNITLLILISIRKVLELMLSVNVKKATIITGISKEFILDKSKYVNGYDANLLVQCRLIINLMEKFDELIFTDKCSYKQIEELKIKMLGENKND